MLRRLAQAGSARLVSIRQIRFADTQFRKAVRP